MPKPKDKSFVIPKSMVWEAWRQVKENKGAPGVDGQDLDEFEADLKGNFYKIWNRMSSGSYFPPPVRAVRGPQAARRRGPFARCAHDRGQSRPNGGGHASGANWAEPRFHSDSYGYRPGRSAPRRARGMPAAVLEVRLGHRS